MLVIKSPKKIVFTSYKLGNDQGPNIIFVKNRNRTPLADAEPVLVVGAYTS